MSILRSMQTTTEVEFGQRPSISRVKIRAKMFNRKAANGMWALRLPAIVLAAGMSFSPSLYAQQTAPDITLPAGDAVRGKAIFEGNKGNCQSCHRVNGVGSLFGPDLSAISAPRGGGGNRGGGGGGGAAAGAARGGGAPAPAAGGGGAGAGGAAGGNRGGRGGGFGGDEVANAAIGGAVPPVPGNAPGRGGQPANPGGGGVPTLQQLAQSLLDPNAVVAPQNRYVQLKMKDGKTISGKLLSVDTFAYQVFDSNEKLMNVPKENIREVTMASPMPSYRDKLSSQELADVISYLMTLKGQQ